MDYLWVEIGEPLSFISCGLFVSDGGWIHAKRSIDSYEVILGVRGTAYLRQGVREYKVGPGQLLLLLPGVEHAGTRVSDGEVSFFWLHFHCRRGHGVVDEKAAERLLEPCRHAQGIGGTAAYAVLPLFLRTPSAERLSVLFRQLLHTANAGYYTAYAADCLTTLLALELTQQTLDAARSRDGEEDAGTFGNLLEWVRINSNRELPVAEIASRFGFNKDYLTRLFKKHTGLTVVQYVNGLRLNRAKELLCTTGQSVKEISYSLGFRDEKYFMKLFKKSESMTPTEYRNLFYRTHLNNQ